jgi:hypothetical protein
LASAFEPAEAGERMRVLASQCSNPGMANDFLPTLLAYCEEISTLGAKAWTSATRQQALAVLLEAGAACALNQRGTTFMNCVEPLLKDADQATLDRVFAAVTDPILRSGQWGTIEHALEALERFAEQKAQNKVWAAYARALSGVIDALYSMNRYATADGFFVHFDRIPDAFAPATMLYRSLALRSKTIAKAREGSLTQVTQTLNEHRELFKSYPIDGLRRSLADSLAEAVPVYLLAGDMDSCTTTGESLWEMSQRFPEDPELASSWLRFAGLTMATYLAKDELGPQLLRMQKMVERFPGVEGVGLRAVEALRELHAADPTRAQAAGPQFLPVFKAVRRTQRRNEAVVRGIDEVCALYGLPGGARGCLFALLTCGLAWPPC